MPKPRLTEPMKRVIFGLARGERLQTSMGYDDDIHHAGLSSPGWEHERIGGATVSALRRRGIIEPAGAAYEYVTETLQNWRLTNRGRQVAEELKREQAKAD